VCSLGDVGDELEYAEEVAKSLRTDRCGVVAPSGDEVWHFGVAGLLEVRFVCAEEASNAFENKDCSAMASRPMAI
jgi:hypothetical protein